MHTDVCHDPQSSSLDITPFRGIGLVELDSNLAKWIKFHCLSSVVAMVHALTLPSYIAQAQTHFLLTIRLTYHLNDLFLAAFQSTMHLLLRSQWHIRQRCGVGWYSNSTFSKMRVRRNIWGP